MNDPYKILNISKDATDDEIKSAYRDLAKKYHPDNYSGNPLSDLAAEKMREINEAYDMVMNDRKRRKAGDKGFNDAYPSGEFSDIRSLIMNGRIEDAEQILDGIPVSGRDAEWHFLKGTIFYKRGWLQEAYRYFDKACDLNPSNAEYAAALNEIKNQSRGGFRNYGQRTSGVNSCSACDMCTGLMCADCCCECMGGDCISCC